MKTTLLFLSVFLSVGLFGQNLVYVPDDVLENKIESICPECDNGIPNDNYVIKPAPNGNWSNGPEIIQFFGPNEGVVNDWTGVDELEIEEISLYNNNTQLIDLSNWGINAQIEYGTVLRIENCPLLSSVILPQNEINVLIDNTVSLQNITFQNSNVVGYFLLTTELLNPISVIDFTNTIGFTGDWDNIIHLYADIKCVLLDNGTQQCVNLAGFQGGTGLMDMCVQVQNPDLMGALFPLYGFYSTQCTNCTSSLTELTTSKNLIQILDLMGRETIFKPNTLLIYVYDDGSIEKVFTIE